MNTFIVIMSSILGLLVGSFLNVVALRFNTGKSLGGRSGCFSCGHQLSWYELIPAFSWVFQGGRCRSCSSKISPLYILGELATGITYGLISARGLFLGLSDLYNLPYLFGTLVLFIIFSILMVILFYDVRHKIIPDELSFAFGMLAFISLFFFSSPLFNYTGFHLPDIFTLLGGVIVPLPFVLLWLVSRGRWLGLGDPKLMVGIGFLFGISQGFSAVFLSFWIGTLFVVSVILIDLVLKKRLLHQGKKSIMKTELPFAPFLIIATLVTIILRFNFFNLL